MRNVPVLPMPAGTVLPQDANAMATIKRVMAVVFPKPVKIMAINPIMIPTKTAQPDIRAAA